MKKYQKYLFIGLLAAACVLLLASCAPGSNTAAAVDAAGKTYGFWSGLWHGIISPVTFIISLFTKNVNLYEIHNNGNWYNFGFMVGISIIFGGGAAGTRRRKKLMN